MVQEAEPARAGEAARSLAWTDSWVTRLALVVVLVNVAFLAWRFLSGPPTVPAYGDRMPPWNGAAVDGTSAGSEFFGGRFGVLLYTHGMPDARLVRYLQVLLDRYWDHGVGLRAALVLAPEHVNMAMAEQLGRDVEFPVVYDSEGDVRRALGLEPHTEHTFLVAPSDRLAFSSPGLLSRDELRQHVEKHLLGEIHYAASPLSLLGPGALLPEYEVVDVRSGTGGEAVPYSPAPGAAVVAFAAALCSACGPDEAYDQVAALHRGQCQTSETECPVELLVTAGFPTSDLLAALEARGLASLRAYQATSSLEGLEDEYFTKRRLDAPEALVLTMGRDRRVLAVSTLGRAAEESRAR